MNILVLGGAGYIGSVVVKQLCNLGYSVVVFDNLSKGSFDLVDSRAEFIKGDIVEYDNLSKVFSENSFDVVMHFAALKDAGESMEKPELYCENIKGTINVLKAISEFGVKKIVFSSSAAVYGDLGEKLVEEEDETNPQNFYGFTKLESEKLLEWYRRLKDVEYVSLRYFNVAGDGGLGYLDPNAKNIFPVIGEVISGKREQLTIFGGDYPTHDGTCIRDYIDVCDLAEAHVKALDVENSHIINLGSGVGFSVVDLVNEFSRQCGYSIDYEIVDRRAGDPYYLVASYNKAYKILGWTPKRGIENMVSSTLEVYNNNN